MTHPDLQNIEDAVDGYAGSSYDETARSADRGPIPPQLDAALGSGPAQSDGGGAAGRTLAIHEMDDATLESAAILAAMTHQATGSREQYTRVLEINAERRRRKQARAA